jgi:uncharacterized protein
MIFLDTSAIYALADEHDSNHGRAKKLFARILMDETPLLTHNYVVVEALALLQHRLGLATASAFADESRSFEMVWIDQETHRQASTRWAKGGRALSFVDHVSFVVMERFQVNTAFAFDSDFVAAGFGLLTSVR